MIKSGLSKKWQEVGLGRKKSFKGVDIHKIADRLEIAIPDTIISRIAKSKPILSGKQPEKVLEWVKTNILKDVKVESRPLEQLKATILKYQAPLDMRNFSFKGVCIALEINGKTSYSDIFKLFEHDVSMPMVELSDTSLNALLNLFKNSDKDNPSNKDKS